VTAGWRNRRAFLWATQIASQAARFLDDYSSAAALADQAITIAETNAPELLPHIQLELGIARRMADDPEAIAVLLDAAEGFGAAQDRRAEAHALIEVGIAQRWRGKLEDSKIAFSRAIDSAESVDDLRTVRRASREAALTLRHLGRTADSVAILDELVAIEPIVDGIDGAWFFADGVRTWGTVIAPECAGEIVLGLLSSPAQDRRWWATRGGGAFTAAP
jgi:tetratricopeptide (TPR) repeat protein